MNLELTKSEVGTLRRVLDDEIDELSQIRIHNGYLVPPLIEDETNSKSVLSKLGGAKR